MRRTEGKMKRIAIVLLALLLASPVSAANFYWKATKTALDAIGADGDRGTVVDSSGLMTTYYRTGGVWTAVSLLGGVLILTDTTGPTAAQMLGSMNIITTGTPTVLLPTAVAGMSMCVMDSGTAHDIIVDVQAGDTITLKGTEGSSGVGITNAAGSTTGDFVCVLSTAANKWSTVGMGGTWASQ
jgi:hypothetical protein